MEITNIYQVLSIDEQSVTPKYQQLVNAIINAVKQGRIHESYLLPSINDLSFELEISRDTAEKAYRKLKQIGLVNSVAGKGYFVSTQNIGVQNRILLMFNKLSQHKKIIYDNFTSTLGESATIDFYIYNNDFALFKKILRSRKDNYTHYVVIPHFMDTDNNPADLLDDVKDGQLILLDKFLPNIRREFGAVYENFEEDIFNALTEALPRLSKYNTIKIIFPSYTYFPEDILRGFHRFCQQYAFNHAVVHNISTDTVGDGEVYINLMEDDLVTLLSKIRETKLEVGKNIGIISYNETPWKQFILNGITTISTDFSKMGAMAADLVKQNSNEHVPVPFTLTLRPSL